eukprot:TRINITY_DN112793_c0_g1_i1.p1 TRINITY_DN112793_c0_g1~~TRINITY_DN112793_c0_g1_i1.p1  ORF type:complete len:314 (+),score=77.63 TRINITY_DN112793_c0_g1_i1:103-1044(+)
MAGKSKTSPLGQSQAKKVLDGAAAAGDDFAKSEEDAEILMKLMKTYKPSPKRKAGARWDGRVQNLTLKEYKEMKWGSDVGFNRTSRIGPMYSLRPQVSFGSLLQRSSYLPPDKTVFVGCDVHKSMQKVKYIGPSFSMGALPSGFDKDKSPGPAEYGLPSTLQNGIESSNKPPPQEFESKITKRKPAAKPPGKSPGPGEYEHERYEASSTFSKLPKWTCAGREAWAPRSTAPGPSPGEYDISKALKNGKNSVLTYSLQGKTEPIEPPRGAERVSGKPAPWTYDPPGAPNCLSPHCSKTRPPQWPFQKESRGLLD